MERCTVSVVIPCYNGAKYLSDCINSVRAQTYKNLEIIVVDDASTDDSYKIAVEIAGADSRIKTERNPKNMGVGWSRNRGMKIAGGEFLVFLDADDLMHPDAIRAMVSAQEKTGADLVVSGYTAVLGDFKMSDNPSVKEDLSFFYSFDNLHEFSTMLMPGSYIMVVVWGKLFRRADLDGFRFTHEVCQHEDVDFMFRFYSRTKIITMIPGTVVYYRRDAGLSITMRQSNTSKEIVFVMKSLAKFVKTECRGGEYVSFLNQQIFLCVWYYVCRAKIEKVLLPGLPNVVRTVRRCGFFKGVKMPLRIRVRLALLSYGIGVHNINDWAY